MIAGVELGGTKTVVAIGSEDGSIIEEFRFPTTLPEETLDVAIDWLRERGHPTDIGIAAFGPIGINPNGENYGQVLATPKPGWAGFSLTHAFSNKFPDARLTLDTDVNAAALAEARIGRGGFERRGLHHHRHRHRRRDSIRRAFDPRRAASGVRPPQGAAYGGR